MALQELVSRGDEPTGQLVAIQASDNLPFCIKRIYYIYNVPTGVRRGFHSHVDLEQLLVCIHGSVKIQVEDDKNSDVVLLDSPSKGLYIGPMIWREMFDFSEGTVLLVLASKEYDANDYIRDHEQFINLASSYFEGGDTNGNSIR